MPQSALFTGIIPPVSTIFTADGQLDKPGTAALIDDLIAAGVCDRSCRSSCAGPDRHRRHQRPGNH